MVRVAALQNAVAEGDLTPDPAGLSPRQQLAQISERAHAMVDGLYDDPHPGDPPRARRARHPARSPLEPRRPPRARPSPGTSGTSSCPILTPLAIDIRASLPDARGPEPQPRGPPRPRRGRGGARASRWCRSLRGLPRLVRPAGAPATTYVLLEEVIRGELGALFPGQAIKESAVFRVARDSELDLDDEGGRDLLEVIEEELKNRRRERDRPARGGGGSRASSCGRSAIASRSARRTRTRVAGPLDIRALFALVDLPALEDLRDPPLKPLPSVEVPADGLFALLDERDVYLHHPYESFDPVVQFVPRPPTTPTSSPSSRRSTARAATRRSSRRSPAPRRTGSRSRSSWSSWPASTSSEHPVGAEAGGGGGPRDLRHTRVQDARQDLPGGAARSAGDPPLRPPRHRQLQRPHGAALHGLRAHDGRSRGRGGRLLVLQRPHRLLRSRRA